MPLATPHEGHARRTSTCCHFHICPRCEFYHCCNFPECLMENGVRIGSVERSAEEYCGPCLRELAAITAKLEAPREASYVCELCSSHFWGGEGCFCGGFPSGMGNIYAARQVRIAVQARPRCRCNGCLRF